MFAPRARFNFAATRYLKPGALYSDTKMPARKTEAPPSPKAPPARRALWERRASDLRRPSDERTRAQRMKTILLAVIGATSEHLKQLDSLSRALVARSPPRKTRLMEEKLAQVRAQVLKTARTCERLRRSLL